MAPALKCAKVYRSKKPHPSRPNLKPKATSSITGLSGMISPALFLFIPLILQLFVITGLVPVIYDYDAYEWIAGINPAMTGVVVKE